MGNGSPCFISSKGSRLAIIWVRYQEVNSVSGLETPLIMMKLSIVRPLVLKANEQKCSSQTALMSEFLDISLYTHIVKYSIVYIYLWVVCIHINTYRYTYVYTVYTLYYIYTIYTIYYNIIVPFLIHLPSPGEGPMKSTPFVDSSNGFTEPPMILLASTAALQARNLNKLGSVII